MNLLELIIKSDIEWPALARIAVQDDGGALKWSMSSDTPVLYKASGVWDRMGSGSDPEYGIIEMADDWSTRIVTREEWQQERDRMQKRDAINDMTPVAIPLPDNNSWYCSAGGINYPLAEINNCTAKIVTLEEAGQSETTITAQDNSWHERGEFPPVGCECEFRYKYSDRGIFCEWESGVILFFGDEIFVVKQGDKENAIDIKAFEFRPLRTDRERTVDDMVAAFQSHYGSEVVARKHAGIAELLYDAGYRKEQAK